MKTLQFGGRPQPQQYGYTQYYPTQGIDLSQIINLVMIIMVMGMMMSMMKGIMPTTWGKEVD